MMRKRRREQRNSSGIYLSLLFSLSPLILFWFFFLPYSLTSVSSLLSFLEDPYLLLFHIHLKVTVYTFFLSLFPFWKRYYGIGVSFDQCRWRAIRSRYHRRNVTTKNNKLPRNFFLPKLFLFWKPFVCESTFLRCFFFWIFLRNFEIYFSRFYFLGITYRTFSLFVLVISEENL